MSFGEISVFSVVEIKAWVGSKLEKRVKRTGSMMVQFSKIEKGLDVSRAREGILSWIFSMMMRYPLQWSYQSLWFEHG